MFMFVNKKRDSIESESNFFFSYHLTKCNCQLAVPIAFRICTDTPSKNSTIDYHLENVTIKFISSTLYFVIFSFINTTYKNGRNRRYK